ncbi:flagellar basal body L-ring protein FlgH [Aeoliella sp. ICT_H6.2]|uniref:Flagellar basal body L-ring protein FlgH n=1 Tax=Aeoliella straminimaris TaxID=2954799 RepID=A0A9X2JIC9_9BACT|nr:flagellar basal body L-ring protein FlgH [Aeoliella straminimaris]MCO6043769.1 flagellar basal body L-ring protein FlgH [Aeoliella straminimaris]
MMNYFTPRHLTLFAAMLMLSVAMASAQEGSLMAQPQQADNGDLLPSGPLTLDQTSFLFRPVPPEAQREVRPNDKIIVIVDYRTAMYSDGTTRSRKTSNFNAALLDWIGFDGRDIFAAPQSRGDPTIAGQLNSQTRAQTELELEDSLTFKIAATVVDIRPNGDLVIEAHRQVRNNEEVWMQSLRGVVARQFVNPDRTVRSDAIAELAIDKREMGQVRDGTNRGWLNKCWGKWKPF